MSSNYISREMDTKQLALKTFLGKCLHFPRVKKESLDIQAK